MSTVLTATGIEQAARRIDSVVRRTALDENQRLSALLGSRTLLKREDQQVCRSYKVRGAFNLMASLPDDERQRGVVCASAGNHGQGVAFACSRLGIRGRVFVPSTTPKQKRERIAAFGGDAVELVVVGSTYDEASAAAHWESERDGAVYVHPFDDVRTMEGQGTVAREILEQADSPVDTLLVPVGGGGLISGIATWVREHSPRTRIIGAEPAGAASMTAALKHGAPVALDRLDSFVDGAAVGKVGEQSFAVAEQLVDDVVAVPEGAVCTEMLDLYQTDGIIAEPAGALASAAARQLGPTAGTTVCVVSGGNNDVSRYSEVVERSLVHVGLRHYFLVTFPQQPGALRHFLDGVLDKGEDIVAFEYVKKSNRETGPALVGIELEDAQDLDSLLRRMADSPLSIERISPGSPLFSFLL
ncbi:threonine ammonia-lyase IlvA [Streptomyces purpurogeneiscleroticus]|uniref:threonine ammonia-lyase IlvA n=1 Tax=Streptomyces purpurogeneiscleroticus TaxID=68259 RepID=UPI001CBEEB3A|nr:threonine ammonia-lyase IlvA [Streptomyces purpurogeneiscleroticus]MBZ4019495.1 threonine dehydratase [Streptomyces purpurogeneiscleroticus]